MKQEFKVGQKVTFHPYEKACACKVMEIYIGANPMAVQQGMSDDDRVFYILSGEATTHTTGKCIEESVLYDPWTEAKRKTFFND